MEIACQWEQKLIEEMTRLTNELNQIHGEERQEAVEKIRIECRQQLQEMEAQYKKINNDLCNELTSLKSALASKRQALLEVQEKSDNQVIQTRMFLERAEREHQVMIDKQIIEHEKNIGLYFFIICSQHKILYFFFNTKEELNEEHEKQKEELEESFLERLQHVKDEFAIEITFATDELKKVQKKELGK